VLVGFRSGLETRLRRRLPASLRSPPAIVLVALPTLRRPAFLLRASDRDAARYFVRRIAFAYREPGDAGVRARLQQTRSRAALLAPVTLALRGAPGRLAVLPGPEMPPSQLQAVGDLLLGSWTALELPGRPPSRLAPLVVGHRRPTTGMVTVGRLGSVLRALAVSPGTWADELNAINTLHLRPPDRHVRRPAHECRRKGPSRG
jgi:hypothetical protein